MCSSSSVRPRRLLPDGGRDTPGGDPHGRVVDGLPGAGPDAGTGDGPQDASGFL
jgi:hypothetical protein